VHGLDTSGKFEHVRCLPTGQFCSMLIRLWTD